MNFNYFKYIFTVRIHVYSTRIQVNINADLFKDYVPAQGEKQERDPGYQVGPSRRPE